MSEDDADTEAATAGERSSLAARAALVTGGGSGIGRSVSIALAGAGASVAVCDRDPGTAAETVRRIEDLGGTACALTLDVRDPHSVSTAVAAASTRFGRLDVAVNAAGIGAPRALLGDTSEQDMSAVVDVNVLGVWRCMAAELPALTASGGGVIVNVASATALRSAPGIGAYGMSKAAVVHLSRTAAAEYGAHRIRVHALCPGPVETPMLARLSDTVRDRLRADVPAGRFGTPEEVADAVVWLCAPTSSFVNGTVLTIDGGESA